VRIDCNANLGPFPFRRLAITDAADLLAEMDEMEVEQAWVGSLESVLHLDPAAANDALFEALDGHRERLLPQPTLNLACCGWERELERCVSEHGARMVRLYPNYHGYGLDDSRVGELAKVATPCQVAVAICTRVFDERSHPPCCSVPPVDLEPLSELTVAWPACRFVVYNALIGEALALADTFQTASNLWLEISHLEGAGVLGMASEQVGVQSLLWGTYTPVFYPEAAALKLVEADLTPSQLAAISAANAQAVLQDY